MTGETSLAQEKRPPAKSGKERVPRRNTLRHRSQTDKRERQRPNTKSSQGKTAKDTQGTRIRSSPDFSTETLQARRERQDRANISISIYKVMKEKNLQLRILYPARFSFRFDGKIKSFPVKQKLKEFSITKPAL